MIQILVPMAGPSEFFKPEDYPFPKPLIEVGGLPMIQRVIENLQTIGEDLAFTFIVQQEHIARFSLDRTLKLLAPNCTIISLRADTRGGLCSALMAIDTFKDDAPLIIANSDQILEVDLRSLIQSFEEAKAAAGVPTFESIHPRWSYVLVNQDHLVEQAVEKRVVSRHAIAGLYYFRNSRLFVEAAFRHLASNQSVAGNFYIAPVLNELILDGRIVAAREIGSDHYFSFYSPPKLKEYEDTLLVGRFRHEARAAATPQAIVPAAGEGKRFAEAGFDLPKPFIDVAGVPMIERVLSNILPSGGRATILLRRDHIENHAPNADRLQGQGHTVHVVESLTEGTACTILLARGQIDDDRPLLIANSDQLVDFSVDAFVGDCMARNLDGSIVVFRDPTRDPKWSYARLGNDGLVAEVAEKKAISDLATVGIYLFRKGSDFVNAAIDMIAHNDRVNNEFYTCPVYNYVIKAGRRIGVYEVPASAMHGLGTPRDLDSYLRARAP
jgi:NDP-sugar pyrophosphorylase family protein